jgi:hypothetical protein
VLVDPEQVAAFILAHPEARFVCHDVGLQFWVVDRHLEDRREDAARQTWWNAVDQNRFSDTMLMAQLIDLARQDAEPVDFSLIDFAWRYARLEPNGIDTPDGDHREPVKDDEDELALRLAEFIHSVHRLMLLEAQRLTVQYRGSDILPGAAVRFGVLTESVQVKTAIALTRIERTGMNLNLERVRSAEALLSTRREAAVVELREFSPQLFKMCRDSATGAESLQRMSGGAPKILDQVLQVELTRVVNDLRLQSGEEIVIPRRKNGGLSTSFEDWSRYAERHPFLDKWLKVKDAERHCQFLAGLCESPVHARYRCLIRTGRTACAGPNLQQAPRDGLVRHAFVPSPGHLLLNRLS